MIADYSYIAVFVLVVLGFAGFMVTLPVILRWLKIVPHHPTPVKGETYECGLVTIGPTWIQYQPRYYLFALMMMAMDVMAVFIYPWTVVLRGLGSSGLLAIFVFILIIAVGYLYAWRKKELEWE
jgi:NADH-quinone oxidoreductase subunit A